MLGLPTYLFAFCHHCIKLIGGISWWERKLSGLEWRNPWLKGNSAEAATASWGLRAMLSQRLIEQSLPVARFLLYAFRPQDMEPDQVKSNYIKFYCVIFSPDILVKFY